MLHRGWRVPLCTVALALLVPASPAWADAEITPEAQAQARMHFQQGKAAFELGNFQEALDQYKTAYKIAPLPGFLFNIGQCQRNLGQYEKAIFSFRLYLKKRPDAQNREAVQLLIKELQRKIEERDRQRVPVYVPESRPIVEPPPPPPPVATPIYKRWWFWTIIVAAAGGAATGIYFGTRTKAATLPSSDLGVWDISRAR